MIRNIFVLFFLILVIFSVFPAKKDFNASTILVIIDESENGETVINEAPVSDGIFDALWENDRIIFFDMKIQTPLNFVNENLDINPFINDAKGAGADSILLIKIGYSFKEEKNNYVLNVKEYYYNFYSIIEQKSLTVGKKELVLNKKIGIEDKNSLLNQLGVRIINEIYN